MDSGRLKKWTEMWRNAGTKYVLARVSTIKLMFRGVKMCSRSDERTNPSRRERARMRREVMVREAAAVRPIRRGSDGTDKMA